MDFDLSFTNYLFQNNLYMDLTIANNLSNQSSRKLNDRYNLIILVMMVYLQYLDLSKLTLIFQL
jgi:hypothetical protein